MHGARSDEQIDGWPAERGVRTLCGLAGLVDLTNAGDPTAAQAAVATMCDAIAHRGPDDSGIEAFGSVVLGSRRLSILDLSTAGHMPMHDPTGRWVIVYNGELYNCLELRAELIERGHAFRSTSDTEVVLHGLMEWGLEGVDRFNGMFAFAVYDRARDVVTLVRDRFGIKPLYYARRGDQLIFSSEVKAIWAALSDARLNQWQLLGWFLYRNAEGLKRDTLIEGVSAVLPGEAVVIERGTVRVQRWHEPVQEIDERRYRHFDKTTPAAVVDEVEGLLVNAVTRQLQSDVRVGVLLSGGLDSSLVTAIAARRQSGLTAFHVSVASAPKLDERRFATELAKQLGMPLIVHELTAADFRRALPRVIQFADFPLTHANAVAYHMISGVARRHGVPVLLSGEGADEVFGGYSWAHRRTMWLERLLPIWDHLPKRFHEIAELLVYAHRRMPVTSHQFRDLLPPTINALDHFARDAWRGRCRDAYAFVPRVGDRAVMASMMSDLEDFLSPLLLRLDRASMGASVEARVPFLDQRLVNAGLNLPLRYRVGRHADKWVLKRIAERYMPAKLVHRRKMGFPTPLTDYLRPLMTPAFFLGGFCEGELGLSPGGIDTMLKTWEQSVQFLFGLVTLEIWGRLFVRRESVEAIEDQIVQLERRVGPGTS